MAVLIEFDVVDKDGSIIDHFKVDDKTKVGRILAKVREHGHAEAKVACLTEKQIVPEGMEAVRKAFEKFQTFYDAGKYENAFKALVSLQDAAKRVKGMEPLARAASGTRNYINKFFAAKRTMNDAVESVLGVMAKMEDK